MNTSLSMPLLGGNRNSFQRNSSAVPRKSLLGGVKKGPGSGRYSISGRSNQSTKIIARSENNIVESYGLPLPVLVNEALTFTERSSTVSVNCSSNGWAWAVSGRRLFIWQYKESTTLNDSLRTPARRGATSQCRELTLPHCDIGHKASLVTVFTIDDQQFASCLAVSPTGDIRYWPSVAHDGSSIDVTEILEGQEFDELLNISPVGYVLGTTTCNLVLLQLQLCGSRYTIVHRAIRLPSGILGGIGRRFSMIFALSNSQEKENKLIKISGESGKKSDGSWIVTLLADKWIQRWRIHATGAETFLFEDHDIYNKIFNMFHKKLWSNRDSSGIEIKFIDMQTNDSKIVILASAFNFSHTPQVFYALITITEENQSFTITNYCQLKHSSFYTGNPVNDSIRMRFTLSRNVAYIYEDKTIFQVYLNGMNDENEKIELPMQGDKIMTAAIHNGTPMFFSRLNGLVCITAADFESPDFFNSSMSSELFVGGQSNDHSFLSASNANLNNPSNLTMYDINPEEVYDSDGKSQLKAAFIYHLKKNFDKASEIVSQLIDNGNTSSSSSSMDLNKIIVEIAKDLAEDIPASDPRWEQIKSSKHSLGSSFSMQIIQQLKEKMLAYNIFIDFLHSTGLWSKLGTISDRGNFKATCHLLSDIGEKIAAAFSLKQIHNNYSKLIDEAIHIVISQRNEQIHGNLTSQDLFYVKVTEIQDIFRVLSNVNDENIQSQQSSARVSSVLSDVNTILLSVISDVMKYRESKATLFALPAHVQNEFEYLPWTTASGKNGLRDILLHQIAITWKHGIRATGEPELRQRHYRQLVDLVDFVLDGRKAYLESIKDTDKYGVMLQQYESQRSDLIYPFVHDGQYELAIKLAEKYLDFQILVQICDKTENQQRLDEYIEKYKEMEFSQFAINWHLRQNKRGDLFERFKHNQADLSRFLGDHPSLAWVQCVFNGDLGRAARTLIMLAQNETELVKRKKTMLSLAKLACLAADEDMSIQLSVINVELFIIGYQEIIPDHLLSVFGYDIVNPRVLKPEEIINLLISEENDSATEEDYRRALELLNHVEDSIDVRHKIWCSVILRDNWTTYNINSPLTDLQNMLLFKLIDLCFVLGSYIEDFLPPIEDFLEAPELASLTPLKSFQFLLKLGYEHINDSYKQKISD